MPRSQRRLVWLIALGLLPSTAGADTQETQQQRLPTSTEPDVSPTVESHEAGEGVRVARGDMGELVFSLYLTIRYLNQRLLDRAYTDSTGTTTLLDRRDDIQLQKTVLYFKGWLADRAFRYLTYVWTSNPSQGLGAQVVVAGNLTYRFHETASVGVGIGALPTTRSTRGTFPRWILQDSRTIADEYFRGSYTTGLWVWGSPIPDVLHYHVMLGNNLSQLGIDARQLDMGLETISGAVWATTDNFGAYDGLGDLESHDHLAATAGVAFTQSREDRQAQPGTNAPENSQIRTSDGRVVFDDNVFAPGTRIERLTYRMATLEGEVKYRGLSLEAELYYRWLDNFETVGAIPIDHLRDWGFQVQASAMVLPKLMVFGAGSTVLGDYGDPWDIALGVNYFPFGNRVMRVQGEMIIVERSPVGNLSSPLIVGADGNVLVMNAELYF